MWLEHPINPCDGGGRAASAPGRLSPKVPNSFTRKRWASATVVGVVSRRFAHALRQLSPRPAVCVGLACLAALWAPVQARAEISDAQTIDGPSSSILGLDGVAMADDGSGGLVYTKVVGGQTHIFVSRLVNEVWQPPEQVDVGQPFNSTWPAIGAGDGGRLVVTWAQPFAPGQDALWSATLDPGSTIFQDPYPIDLDVGEATALYPSLAMSRGGQAYVSYRVLTGTNPDPNLPPGYVHEETRVAHYDGEFWSVLGVANRNPAAPVPTPTAANSPQIGIDEEGNGMIAFQEPDDAFVNRIYARRLFSSTIGFLLDVSPQTFNGASLQGGADAFSLSDAGFGAAAIAFRQESGPGDPLHGTRIMVATIPDQFNANGNAFTTARFADGGGGAGLGSTTPGVPSVAEAPKGDEEPVFALGDATIGVPGTAITSSAPERFDDGSSTIPGDPVITLADSGAQTVAYKIDEGGADGVAIRERGSDGVADTKAVYATLAGPVNQLMLSGSGLGDAAVAFEQGSGSFAQIAGAVVDVAPDTFAVNTPLVWVRSRLVPISWAPAPNAIGPVTYTVTVDDTDVADGLTRTSINLGPGDISDGTHTLAVIATDEQGQSVTSLTNTVQVDRTPPRATIRVSGRRATVRVFDATSGLAAASVGFGDGAHGGAHARHTYGAPGHYVITIRARDRAGNRAVIRRRVRIR